MSPSMLFLHHRLHQTSLHFHSPSPNTANRSIPGQSQLATNRAKVSPLRTPSISSPPYSPPSSYHSVMQERDLSDNESMAMSVESSPSYSPASPSSRTKKRSTSDVELPVRKRRRTSTHDIHQQHNPIEAYRRNPGQAEPPDSHYAMEDQPAIHPSRLQQIGHSTITSPAPAAPLVEVMLPLSKRAEKRARGTPLGTIQGQMRRLESMLDKIGTPDRNHVNAPQTGSALQKRLKKLGEGLMNPHKDINQRALDEARGLKSQAEAYIQHNRAYFDRASTISDENNSTDGDSDGGAPLGWKSCPLNNSAILATPDDDQLHKRRKLSSTSSCSETEVAFRQVSSASTSSTSTSTTTSLASIASETEIEDFLSDLSDSIQASTLRNLCPDNMRGTFCHTPDACHLQSRFFACPEYAILKGCPQGRADTFTHFGYKHTINGCAAHHRTDCKRAHRDGRPCRVEVVYFHVRASCITLRGGKNCQMKPCQWGHDFEEIRRVAMKK